MERVNLTAILMPGRHGEGSLLLPPKDPRIGFAGYLCVAKSPRMLCGETQGV